jgi:hypothetical protein
MGWNCVWLSYSEPSCFGVSYTPEKEKYSVLLHVATFLGNAHKRMSLSIWLASYHIGKLEFQTLSPGVLELKLQYSLERSRWVLQY